MLSFPPSLIACMHACIDPCPVLGMKGWWWICSMAALERSHISLSDGAGTRWGTSATTPPPPTGKKGRRGPSSPATRWCVPLVMTLLEHTCPLPLLCRLTDRFSPFRNKPTNQPHVLCVGGQFLGGAGKFFEGTPADMHESLFGTLAALPAETLVYCGHEVRGFSVQRHVTRCVWVGGCVGGHPTTDCLNLTVDRSTSSPPTSPPN